MTDEAALLDTIRDRPDDDTPRLVYADFVEERGGSGDAEFAEFIRVGCELAKTSETKTFNQLIHQVEWHSRKSSEWGRNARFVLSNPADRIGVMLYDDANPEHQTLCSRERELWPAVRGRFEAVVPQPTIDGVLPVALDENSPVTTFRRGLPAEVRGPLAVLVGGGRTPGIVAELRRSWPVVRAVAVDKKPLEFDGRFLWHNAEHRLTSSEHDNDTRPPDHLPAELFNRLSGFIPRDAHVTDAVRGWPTEPAAFNALSTAIIAVADGQIAKGVEHAAR